MKIHELSYFKEKYLLVWQKYNKKILKVYQFSKRTTEEKSKSIQKKHAQSVSF